MKVLTASVELTLQPSLGGLGGMIVKLAQAMKREGAEVTVLAPYYGPRSAAGGRLAHRLSGLAVTWQGEELELPLLEGALSGNVRIFFVEHPSFVRSGIYGDGQQDWPDNPERFGLFCRAVAAAAAGMLRPDVVHLHDWPTGLVPYYLHREGGAHPPTVLGLYDLAFQGHFPAAHLPTLDIPPGDFTPDNLEFFGHLNFLKAGVRHADGLVAMGRDHRRAITSPEGGHGLDGLLRHRGKALVGIPLGIDEVVFSPQRDPHLAQTYGVEKIGGKRVCKRALQDELGLPGRADVPLVGFAPPLSGLLEPAALPDLVAQSIELGMQVALLPSAEEPAPPAALLDRFPEECGVLPAGSDEAYHRLLAGCDLLVAPGHFQVDHQPQREALRYGTLPVACGEGALEDSQQGRPLGFEAPARTTEGLLAALREAVGLYRDQKGWRLLMLEGMSLDLSWQACAREYLDFFSTLLPVGTAGTAGTAGAAGGNRPGGGGRA